MVLEQKLDDSDMAASVSCRQFRATQGWDAIFLTYDENDQINSVVKSLVTWRAARVIG